MHEEGTAPIRAAGLTPLQPVPLSAVGLVLEILSAGMILANFGTLLFTWTRLPQTVPTHFNFGGEPDGWGSRAALWILPAVSAAVYVGLTFAARLPHGFNYPVKTTTQNAQQQYAIAVALIRSIKVEVAALLLIITIQSVRVAIGSIDNAGTWLPLGVTAAILATVVLYFVRAFRAR